MLGSKTDPIIARDMATLALYDGFIQPSYIGTTEFHEFRDMIRAYHNMRGQLTRHLKIISIELWTPTTRNTSFNFGLEWMIGVLDEYLAKDCTLQEAFMAYIATQQTQGKKMRIAEKNATQLGPYGDIRLDRVHPVFAADGSLPVSP